MNAIYEELLFSGSAEDLGRLMLETRGHGMIDWHRDWARRTQHAVSRVPAQRATRPLVELDLCRLVRPSHLAISRTEDVGGLFWRKRHWGRPYWQIGQTSIDAAFGEYDRPAEHSNFFHAYGHDCGWQPDNPILQHLASLVPGVRLELCQLTETGSFRDTIEGVPLPPGSGLTRPVARCIDGVLDLDEHPIRSRWRVIETDRVDTILLAGAQWVPGHVWADDLPLSLMGPLAYVLDAGKHLPLIGPIGGFADMASAQTWAETAADRLLSEFPPETHVADSEGVGRQLAEYIANRGGRGELSNHQYLVGKAYAAASDRDQDRRERPKLPRE